MLVSSKTLMAIVLGTMPTYPHYKPGNGMPSDKLLILEDTDGDGVLDSGDGVIDLKDRTLTVATEYLMIVM